MSHAISGSQARVSTTVVPRVALGGVIVFAEPSLYIAQLLVADDGGKLYRGLVETNAIERYGIDHWAAATRNGTLP
jgi:hypothetical protein